MLAGRLTDMGVFYEALLPDCSCPEENASKTLREEAKKGFGAFFAESEGRFDVSLPEIIYALKDRQRRVLVAEPDRSN
jgi:hypothetical protein